MPEPTIICPNCKTEIKLTESLAAPLIESTRREFEQRFVQNNAEIAKREKALSKAREAFDEQVSTLTFSSRPEAHSTSSWSK